MVNNLIYRIFIKFRTEIDLYFWQQDAKILKFKSPIKENKSILISNLSTIAATSKFEAILSYLFLENNYKVYILLEQKNKIIEKIFTSIGKINFIYLDDISNKIDINLINKKADYIINNNFSNLINCELDHIRIGRNVLSKVVRYFRVGQIDIQNPEHINYTKEILLKSLITIEKFNLILQDYNFNVALFNERGYTPAGEIFDICIKNNIDVIQWIGSPTPNSFSFKRYNKNNKDQHPLSLSNEGWVKLSTNSNIIKESDSIINYLKSLYKSDGTYNYQELNKGKLIISERNMLFKYLNITNNNKVAVIFCHILYDATFFYGTSLFDNYQKWLIETVSIAIKNTNINWIIKVHPVNVWRSKMDGKEMEQIEKVIIENTFGKLPSHINFMPADTNINTLSLFTNIDFGITVRGTVGMELPCFNVPVITAGTGRYNNHGFTIDPKSKEEYLELLMNLHTIPYTSLNYISQNAQVFSYITLQLRAIKIESINLKLKKIVIFSKKKEFILEVNKDFYKNGDQKLYSIFNWIDKGTELEYLNKN